MVLLDIERPTFGWLRAIDQVLHIEDHPSVVCVSASGDSDFLTEIGAAGALTKAIKDLSHGEVQSLLHEIVEGQNLPATPEASGTNRSRRLLTAREREILKLVAHGSTSQEIAAELGLSVRTVEFHRANILRKTGARSPADATRYAVQSGILNHV